MVLLAEPETERAAISPAGLLGRLRQLARGHGSGGLAGRNDRDLALLRLAPGAEDLPASRATRATRARPTA